MLAGGDAVERLSAQFEEAQFKWREGLVKEGVDLESGAILEPRDAGALRAERRQAFALPLWAKGDIGLTLRWALWRVRDEEPVTFWGGAVAIVSLAASSIVNLILASGW